jgi:hypothetical protein
MRLQAVHMPNTLNAAAGDTGRGRHAAHAPVRRIRWLLVQRHVLPKSPPPSAHRRRALQTTFCGVFRSRTNRSNRSRSAALTEICSIFLIGVDSQIRVDL